MSTPTSPIPITFCITDLDPGGAERALVQLVTRLDRNRWRPRVICLDRPGALVEVLQAAEIPVDSLHARQSSSLAVLWRLRRLLKQQRPVILQTFLHHANILGRCAAWLAGVPHVVSGIRVAEQRGRWRLRLDRWTAFLVDRHVCVSDAVREFSVEQGGLPADRTLVIPNGVDLDTFANADPADLFTFDIPPKARVILSVGRLDPQKAPDVTLDAFRPLSDLYEDVHLLFVGDGPLREELEAKVGEHRLQRRVHFAGQRDDVPAIMRAAFCLVLSSRWEGMPNVVLEAMAAGLPVIATRVEGIDDLIDEGRTGLTVAAESVDSLSAALTGYLDDPAAARDMADCAQTFVANSFQWDAVAQQYAQLYHDLLSAPAHR